MPSTILIIDDDRALRSLLALQLERAGHHVLEAGTAREGQTVLEQQQVDLAIVDGLLPDTRGVQLIARLRERDTELPVVFISAYWRDLSTYRRLTDELGVALVLYKPLDAERLAAKVTEIVRARRPQLEVAEQTYEDMEGLRAQSEVDGLDLDIEVDEGADQDVTPTSLPGLDDLVNEYTESLPQRIAELRDALRGAESSPEALGHALRLAHRLRGTAGTYGFEAVSAAAGEIEDSLVMVQDEGVPMHALQYRIDRALEHASLGSRRASSRPVLHIVPEQGDYDEDSEP
jgi:DNA-binding response OmpR family regulator/HPt (histidine-containing phosphotransfer) domain-containing protein